jgi:hypothetical protein
VVAVEGGAGGGDPAFVVDQILQTDGHPGQRADDLSPLLPPVDLVGAGQGLLVVDEGESVQRPLGGVRRIQSFPNPVD